MIAYFDLVGIGKRDKGQHLFACIDLKHRKVGSLVGEKNLRIEFAPVGQHYADVGGVPDDVMIGDDDARTVDNDAGAERVLHSLPGHAEGRYRRRSAERTDHRQKPTAP